MTSNPPEHDHAARRAAQGVVCGVGAYGLWGLMPFYFRSLAGAAPLEILAQRIAWSFAVLLVIVVVTRRLGDVWQTLRSKSVMLTLAASTTLIAINWFTYIYAVSDEQVVQASLGYFITPLVNVLLGVGVLGERLRRAQIASLALAAVGVGLLIVLGGEAPWISLVLAVSFACYGLARKMVPVDGPLGLFVETLLLAPPALACASWFSTTGDGVFGHDTTLSWLMVLGGPVTTVPLLLFAGAARRLRLATMGFLQFITPTLQFLVAVLAFGELLTTARLASFACIWVAVGIYSVDAWRAYRRTRADPPTVTASTVVEVDAVA